MTRGEGASMLELTAERKAPLAQLVAAWLTKRSSDRSDARRVADLPESPDHDAAAEPEPRVEVREVEVIRMGRPILLDVLAEVDGRAAHAVLGVRSGPAPDSGAPDPVEAATESATGAPNESGVEDEGLGLIHDDQGLAVVIDVLHDADLAHLTLEAVTGEPGAGESVTMVSDSDDGIVLDFGGRCTFTVFPWLLDGPNLGVEMLLALDEAGFNHLAAPLAVWRRGGRDLGVVQEQLVGSAGGWALALTSLRDLYGFGGRPEEAGGDFGPEAQALGTMTARMHLALERAFGQTVVAAAEWVDQMEATVAAANPSLLDGEGVAAAVAAIRASGLRTTALRTHGDFHLGRTARTDLGWVVADFTPGGRPLGADRPVFRSPLADVADMLWSIHHVSTVANAERDPTGREGTTVLSRSWAARNRHTFLTAYLAAPGIAEIAPSDRTLVRHLVTVFELERAASPMAHPA